MSGLTEIFKYQDFIEKVKLVCNLGGVHKFSKLHWNTRLEVVSNKDYKRVIVEVVGCVTDWHKEDDDGTVTFKLVGKDIIVYYLLYRFLNGVRPEFPEWTEEHYRPLELISELVFLESN